VIVAGIKWDRDHYIMVRWSFVEAWKAAVTANPADPTFVTPDHALRHLNMSMPPPSEGQTHWWFGLPHHQFVGYASRIQQSLEQCGLVNTKIIPSVMADPVLLQRGCAIRLQHGTVMQLAREPEDGGKLC